MPKETYAERLTPYIHELSTATKNELLLKLAVAVFTNPTEGTTGRLVAFDEAQQLLSNFRPNLHEPFDRATLVASLGEYLAESWGEVLEHPLTGRDLDRLLAELPESGVRQALKRWVEGREAGR